MYEFAFLTLILVLLSVKVCYSGAVDNVSLPDEIYTVHSCFLFHCILTLAAHFSTMLLVNLYPDKFLQINCFLKVYNTATTCVEIKNVLYQRFRFMPSSG